MKLFSFEALLDFSDASSDILPPGNPILIRSGESNNKNSKERPVEKIAGNFFKTPMNLNNN